MLLAGMLSRGPLEGQSSRRPGQPSATWGQRLDKAQESKRPHPEDPGVAVSRATGGPTCPLCVMELFLWGELRIFPATLPNVL